MIHNFAQTRLSAFFIHLVFSALIAFTVILAAILVWYPDYFLDVTGAKKIFLMIVGIDVCIGPILTLIVFNKKKKELGRDLTIIFLIQLCALVYGMYTVTMARPVYIVFAVDRFELVQANEISKNNLLDASQEKFRKLPWLSAEWISALRPSNPKEKEELLFTSMETGDDLAQLPKFYSDYAASVDEIRKRLIPLAQLAEFNPDKMNIVTNLTQRFNDKNRYGYLPLSGKKASLTVIIDIETGKPVEISNLEPWQ